MKADCAAAELVVVRLIPEGGRCPMPGAPGGPAPVVETPRDIHRLVEGARPGLGSHASKNYRRGLTLGAVRCGPPTLPLPLSLCGFSGHGSPPYTSYLPHSPELRNKGAATGGRGVRRAFGSPREMTA